MVAAAKSLIGGQSQFVKQEEWGQVSGEGKERGGRRKKKGRKIWTQKHAALVSEARLCFENVLPLEPECQIASLSSRSAKGEPHARPCQRVSSTPLLTHVFIRPPTLEIKFTRHFMLLLFMSSTAAHFMGFCLPLQAHFRSPPSVLRCHLLLSFVLPKVFFLFFWYAIFLLLLLLLHLFFLLFPVVANR